MLTMMVNVVLFVLAWTALKEVFPTLKSIVRGLGKRARAWLEGTANGGSQK